MKKLFKTLVLLVMMLSFTTVFAEDKYNHLQFIKKDDKGNIVTNAEFKQSTLNGYTFDVSEVPSTKGNESNDGRYNYIYAVNDTAESYKLLTKDQKAIFDKLNTIDDYNRIKDGIYSSQYRTAYCTGKDAFVNYLKTSKGITVSEIREGGTQTNLNPAVLIPKMDKYTVKKVQSESEPNIASILFLAHTFSIIEETRTPQGLEKTNIVVPMMVNLEYRVEADGTLVLTNAHAMQDKPLLKYNSSVDYSNIADAFSKISNSDLFENSCSDSKWHDYTCTPDIELQNNNGIVGSSSGEGTIGFADASCISTVVDKTSTEDLTKKVEITTYVNGKKEVRVKKNQEVTISVKVYNSAKTPLYTNKIVSKVPSGLTINESSIQQSGVYDKESNTVSWNVDYLDADSAVVLSYKVLSPSDIKDSVTVKTSATLTSFGEDNPLVSNEATVGMGEKVKNPETGVYSEIVMIILLIASISGVFIFFGKNLINSI